MGLSTGHAVRRRNVFALALLSAVVLSAVAAAGASAAAPSPLWTRCDGGPGDVSCIVPRGIATAPAGAPEPGSVYVADQGNTRIVQYSAWGELVRTWGTKGSGPGQLETGLGGIAVDSTGNVYILDKSNQRVQKFDPTGNFVLMIGGKVNKTKVEEGAPEAQQNLCTAASGDVCQMGTAGTGNGQFAVFPVSSFIAIGTSDRLYVGDEKRIQIFNPDGTFKENQPDPDGAIAKGTVNGLAILSGNLFFSLVGKADVTKLNSSGKEQCKMKAASPAAVAAGAGSAYVVDGSGASLQVRQFSSSSCAETEAPFGQGEITNSTGIATGTACLTSGADIYVTNTSPSFASAYGLPPNKPATCPKPLKAPDIAAEYALSVASFTTTVRAEINPHFYADTTYYVQYGTAACVEAEGWEAPCVKASPAPPGNTLAAAGDTPATSAGIFLSSLLPGTEYRFRFVAQSGGGGPTLGEERSFHTFGEPSTGGEACANDLFRTEAGALLPDCRAYEMVSPIDKEGADIVSGQTPISNPAARNQSATSGEKLAYTARQRFGDAISQPFNSQYIASRTGAGWQTHGISPPRGVLLGGVLTGEDSEYKLFSDDLCSAWLVTDETTAPSLTPAGEELTNNAYRRSNCGSEGYEALGWGKVTGYVKPMEVQGTSADGSEAIIRSEAHLSQDVGTPVGMEPKCQTPTAATTIAFQWLRNGEAIAGKTNAIYKTEAPDAGKAIQCRVTATNANGGSTQVANPAWIIAPYPGSEPPQAPQSIAAPSASEPLTVGGVGGQTLSCDPNAAAWGGAPSFSYRWYRNGAEIAGATEPTYVVSASDLATPAAFQCEAIGTSAGVSVAKTSDNATTTPPPSGPATPAVDARTIAAGPSAEQGPMVYLAGGTGGPRSVCVLPDATAVRGCTAGTLAGNGGYEGSVKNAISNDGKRIYWSQTSVFGGASKLYLRENADKAQSAIDGGGECSEAAKACTIAVSAGAAQFLGASPDGARAIYLEASIGATGKLFEFDAESGESSEIAGGVSGLLGMSEDATRIYLASTEVLSATPNSEGDLPQAGKANLYLYDAGGGFAFVATLPGADAAVAAGAREPSPISLIPVGHAARVSQSGEAAAFVSTGKPTGYDNTDADSGEADMEVYRYDAGSGGLKCISCNPSGARPVGKHVTENGKKYWAAAQIQPAEHQLYFSRALSDDGDRLFFESYEPLVLSDTNGKRDVYQWEALGKGSCKEGSPAFSQSAGGCIGLISSGKSPQDSEFADASPSGNDVFFTTGSSLLPSDPGSIDLYDARVGGGFPQPEPAPPCEGDACQGPPSPPGHPTPASSSFRGPGSQASPIKGRCAKGKKRVTRKGKARCVKRHHRRAAHKNGRAGR